MSCSSADLIYCGALCEMDCVWLNMGRDKDNNYSRDKRGDLWKYGPTAAAYIVGPTVTIVGPLY